MLFYIARKLLLIKLPLDLEECLLTRLKNFRNGYFNIIIRKIIISFCLSRVTYNIPAVNVIVHGNLRKPIRHKKVVLSYAPILT